MPTGAGGESAAKLPRGRSLSSFFTILFLSPFLLVLRFLIRWITPRLPNALRCPFLGPRVPREGQAPRVAVVGGGIAGVSAAFGIVRLRRDATVDLFEARPVLGGNAKTHLWDCEDSASSSKPSSSTSTAANKKKNQKEKETVRTGLSVLAWPREYFHTYEALVKELGIDSQDVALPFVVDSELADAPGVFSNTSDPRDAGISTLLKTDAMKADLARWHRVVAMTRFVNKIFSSSSSEDDGSGEKKSLYASSYFNPLNFIPMYWVIRLMGVSKAFWDAVIVPIYSSTFLTVRIKTVPATICPAIDDMIPLAKSPVMGTWVHDSSQVFQAMTADERCRVHLNKRVESVARGSDGLYTITFTDGSNASGFADVVFGCPSPAALAAINTGGCSTFAERALLGSVSYVDDTDDSFMTGIVHRDASVLPAGIRGDLLDRFANYIRVTDPSPGSDLPAVENTFIVSGWFPAAKRSSNSAPCLVTYNRGKGMPAIDPSKIVGEVDNSLAHPTLDAVNLATSMLLRLVQGKRGRWHCTSWSLPANGHDLSLLAGLAVATAITEKHGGRNGQGLGEIDNSKVIERDFNFLRAYMGV